MQRKNHIGTVVSVHFTDRETPVYGWVIDQNKEWLLMKNNPVDYIIDGYIIVRLQNLKSIRRGKAEQWRQEVMQLKGLQPTEQERIPLDKLTTILDHLTQQFGLFQVSTDSEHVCYLGKLRSADAKTLVLDSLNPKGKWDGTITFEPDDIRVIEFETDYVQSLKLVAMRYRH